MMGKPVNFSYDTWPIEALTYIGNGEKILTVNNMERVGELDVDRQKFLKFYSPQSSSEAEESNKKSKKEEPDKMIPEISAKDLARKIFNYFDDEEYFAGYTPDQKSLLLINTKGEIKLYDLEKRKFSITME